MKDKVFVTSRSFSQNKFLRKKLLSIYPNSIFNETGRKLKNSELISSAIDCNKIIVALDKIDKNVLVNLPKLKVISKYGVGLDMINLKDLEKFKVKLGWEKGQNSRAVSELVMGYIFSISRNLYSYQKSLKQNNIFKQIPSEEITNKKIGIIGCGSIGSDLLKLLTPLKCKIYINDIRKIKINNSNHIQCSINELLKNSDIVSIHTPLTKKTISLVNEDNLKYCKKNILFINCSRGGIINEDAIYKFLKINKIANAAFDVFQNEPPMNNKLLKLENFYCTPHIGGSTNESIINMGLTAIRGLDNFVSFRRLYKYGYE